MMLIGYPDEVSISGANLHYLSGGECGESDIDSRFDFAYNAFKAAVNSVFPCFAAA